MSTADIEQRVAALETQYAQLLEAIRRTPSSGTWRSVVGMFADDPHIADLHRETQRIREEDRAESRDAGHDES